MGRPRISPTPKELERFLADGLTHEQIVEKVYEATGVRLQRTTISSAIVRAGLAEQQKYEDEIPWRVKTEHQRDYPVKMLRCLARRRAGKSLTEDENYRLDSWLARMERDGTVVVYDSDVGFAYAARADGDPMEIPVHPVEVRLT